MKNSKLPDFSDRRVASAEAKAAMLARFKPKPMVTASPEQLDRAAKKAAELEAVRAARAAEKEAARLAKAKQDEEARKIAAAAEAAALEAKRLERKEWKQGKKQDAQSRRQERMAAYGRISTTGANEASYDEA
jgi:hypothetical protein